MAMIGVDFQRGRKDWLYNAINGHSASLAIGSFLALVLLTILGQNVAALAGYALLGGVVNQADMTSPAGIALSAKSTVIGLLPVSIIVGFAAYKAAALRQQDPIHALALRWPQLGTGGWAIVLVGFLIAVYLINTTVFLITGINPQEFAPTPDGVLDPRSGAGTVEKVIADLVDEPFLFALAIPGIAIAVPVMEEIVFRGAFFSWLQGTRVGAPGAIVITSGLWAMMHAVSAPWLFVSLIFLMGLVLGVLLVRFGSLWVTIICHCLWNTLSSITIFLLVTSS